MAAEQPPKQSAWRQPLAAFLLAGGIAMVAVSFFWPSDSSNRANWSPQQARAYQAASVKLHSMSHETAHAAGSQDEKAVREKFDQAKAEYDALRGELDAAIDSPKNIRYALRIFGSLVAIAGLALNYVRADD